MLSSTQSTLENCAITFANRKKRKKINVLNMLTILYWATHCYPQPHVAYRPQVGHPDELQAAAHSILVF